MPSTIQAEVRRFIPRTLSDALASNPVTEDNPPGSCQILQNLVPDRATPGFYAPRPSLTAIQNLSSSTTGISIWLVLGSRIWYMQNNGSNVDVPKCFDTSIGAAVTITESGSPQHPTSPTTSGDWTPPDMAQVGSKIVITHPGFSGANYIGWIDISNPASPVYHTGDVTGGITFAGLNQGLPSAVENFNGRAYYALGNQTVLSDSLAATVVTNASQILTIGDNQPITGLKGQPFLSTTQGGIIAALAVFKALSIAQITGDPVNSNLALNVVTSNTGTQAPLTLAVTPKGIMFMANDGLRALGLTGEISEPVPSVKLPFDYAVSPSRACAAYNDGAYRITVLAPDSNGNNNLYEYVYDLKYGWSGPHTCPASLIAPISDSSIYHFVTYNINQAGGLCGPYYSNVVPHPADTYTEYGVGLTWEMKTCFIETGEADMDTRQIAESTLQYISSGTGDIINLSAIDPVNGTVATAQIMGTTAAYLWGGTTWGGGLWNSGQGGFQAYTVPWSNPIGAFKDIQFDVTGTSALKQRIGWLTNRVRHLPMTNTDLKT